MTPEVGLDTASHAAVLGLRFTVGPFQLCVVFSRIGFGCASYCSVCFAFMVARLFGSLVPLPGREVTVCVTVAPPMGLLGPVALDMWSEKEKSFSGPGEQTLQV